jgi:hypothetical protein
MEAVITAHSRSKNGVASARLCRGDPRLAFFSRDQDVDGPSPAMTKMRAASVKAEILDRFLANAAFDDDGR